MKEKWLHAHEVGTSFGRKGRKVSPRARNGNTSEGSKSDA